MLYANRWQIKSQLQKAVEGAKCQQLLQQIGREFPVLSGFPSWASVFDRLAAPRTAEADKDAILGAMVWSAQEESNPAWNSILTLAMWPGLESIHRLKSKWDRDPEEHWQLLTWTYLEVIHSLNVIARRDNIAGRIYNTVVHNLYDRYRREWDRGKVEVNLGTEAYDDLADELVGLGREAVDSDLRLGGLLRSLDHLLREGIITHFENQLIRSVDVAGMELATFAAKRGMTYAAAKKARQRALAKVRAHIKISNDQHEFLSPRG